MLNIVAADSFDQTAPSIIQMGPTPVALNCRVLDPNLFIVISQGSDLIHGPLPDY
jgi:hypothetical protein